MTPLEIKRVKAYLRDRLNDTVNVTARTQSNDSAEVYLGEEFVALIFKIVEEGETSYQMQWTILTEDLEDF
jgi:hypothetical protein